MTLTMFSRLYSPMEMFDHVPVALFVAVQQSLGVTTVQGGEAGQAREAGRKTWDHPGPGQQGVVQRHQVRHRVTHWEPRAPGIHVVSRPVPGGKQGDRKNYCGDGGRLRGHLEYCSWETSGDLLSCSMASCGEGLGKGRTLLGGLPGLVLYRHRVTRAGPGGNMPAVILTTTTTYLALSQHY